MQRPSSRKQAISTTQRPPDTRKHYRRFIFVLSCLVYVNTLSGELVFDDHEAIVSNRDVRPSTPLKAIFEHDFWGVPLRSNDSHKSYRPLTTLTFRWNYALHHLQPWGYHAANVLLHATVAAIVFDTYSILFRSEKACFAAALLFALHPIHTEAVAGVVGRADLLAALFYLLAFRAYARAFRGGRDVVSCGWLGVSAAFAAFSTLCKETGITVLASCAAFDILYACDLDGREIVSLISRGQCSLKWIKSLWKRLVFLIVVLCLFLTFRIYFLAGGVATSFVESDNPTLFDPDWLTRFRTYFYLAAFNTWLLLSPYTLCYDWSMDSIPRLKTFTDIRNSFSLIFAAGLSILILFGLFWRKTDTPLSNGNIQGDKVKPLHNNELDFQHQRKVVTMGLCLTIAPFLPASNLFFPVGFVVAERVLYLPSIGFCLLIGLGLQILTKQTKLLFYVFYGLLLVFALKTIQRNSEWLDTKSLAEAGIKINPGNAKVHLTLGNHLAQKGLRVCEKSYREAIQLRPHYAAAWTNLGLVLLNTERPSEAEEAYKRALKHKPDSADASTNYGHLCRLQDRWEEADQFYRIALRRRPHDPGLNYNLGLVNEKMKRFKIAEAHYRHVILAEPLHGDAGFRLADLLATTNSNYVRLKAGELAGGKRAKKAESAYRSALQHRGDYVDGWMALGKLLLHNNNLDDAEVVFRRVTTNLDPKHSAAQYFLGKTMERKGVSAEAAKAFRLAIELDSSNTLARTALNLLLSSE